MKRVRRIILNALTVLSLLLCVGAIAASMNSFRSNVVGFRYHGHSRSLNALLRPHGLFLAWGSYVPGEVAERYAQARENRRRGFIDTAATDLAPGFSWAQYREATPFGPSAGWRAPGLWVGAFEPWGVIRSRYVLVGYPWLITACAVLPVARFLGSVRRSHRQGRIARGACPQCDYDLL